MTAGNIALLIQSYRILGHEPDSALTETGETQELPHDFIRPVSDSLRGSSQPSAGGESGKGKRNPRNSADERNEQGPMRDMERHESPEIPSQNAPA